MEVKLIIEAREITERDILAWGILLHCNWLFSLVGLLVGTFQVRLACWGQRGEDEGILLS